MIVPSYETYVINLDRAKDRLEMIEKEFSKKNMSFERIEAVDAKKLDKYDFIVKNKYDRDLLPGEIACSLSHLNALKAFLESDNLYGLILEDDVLLCDNFKDIMEEVLSTYNDLPKKDRWDVLKLYNNRRRHIRVKGIADDYFLAACGISIPAGTVAAVWTRDGAKKFLNKLANPASVVRMPIDCELQHPWSYGLRIYNLLPSPITHPGDFETQISLPDDDRKSKLIPRIIYEGRRALPKYYYLISHHGIKEFYNSFIAKKTPRIS